MTKLEEFVHDQLNTDTPDKKWDEYYDGGLENQCSFWLRPFVKLVRERAEKTEGDSWYALAVAFDIVSKELGLEG